MRWQVRRVIPRSLLRCRRWSKDFSSKFRWVWLRIQKWAAGIGKCVQVITPELSGPFLASSQSGSRITDRRSLHHKHDCCGGGYPASDGVILVVVLETHLKPVGRDGAEPRRCNCGQMFTTFGVNNRSGFRLLSTGCASAGCRCAVPVAIDRCPPEAKAFNYKFVVVVDVEF